MVEAQGVVFRLKAEAAQHLADARLVGVSAAMFKFVLHRAILFDDFFGAGRIGHFVFETGQFGLLFD